MELKIKRLNKNATLPIRGSQYSAGLDLYACIDTGIDIVPGQTVKIGTGFAAAIPEGYFGMLVPRSGIATKRGLRPANTPGTIDADYRGEIIVALHNESDSVQHIEPQERIAQLIIVPYLPVDLQEVEELSETERADGGFGHTGTN